MALPKLVIPRPMPARKVPGYAMPEDDSALLGWDYVAERMTAARNYWLSTTGDNGQPHVAPVWGLWAGDRLHFEGTDQTKWGRNLLANPRITVHLPDGERVVIVEGVAHKIDDDELTEAEWAELDNAYRIKYSYDEGSPFRYVEPSKVIAWDGDDLHTMTRWVFDAPD